MYRVIGGVMKIVGLPSDSKKLQAYLKLLGVSFPYTLKGTLGIWLSSQLSIGYYAIDGYSIIKENLPIQNLDTYVKCAFRVKLDEDILEYTIDSKNSLLFFIHDNELKSLVRCVNCDITYNDESYVFVNCKNLDCRYKISRRNYEIRRVI